MTYRQKYYLLGVVSMIPVYLIMDLFKHDWLYPWFLLLILQLIETVAGFTLGYGLAKEKYGRRDS